MLKFIRLWILRYKLAQLFKQAELYVERGVEKGNDVYASLHDQACVLVGEFIEKYPGNYGNAFPALSDLEELATEPEPPSIKPALGIIAIGIGFVIGSAFAIGGYVALVNFAYHLFVR
jgi:hypothetical protein